MSITGVYYELLFEMEASDYRLGWLDKPQYQKELHEEQETNAALKKKKQDLEATLSLEDPAGEHIRSALMHITHAILKSLNLIEQSGTHYPDLDQSMVIRGYLFGQILSDYRNALTSEGNFYPHPHIYASTTVWPAHLLKELIQKISTQLYDHRLLTKIDAILYFEQIRADFMELIDNLKHQHIL